MQRERVVEKTHKLLRVCGANKKSATARSVWPFVFLENCPAGHLNLVLQN